MLRWDQLKVGMILKFLPSSTLYYTVLAVGDNWITVRKPDNDVIAYNRDAFNLNNAFEVKPKIKRWINFNKYKDGTICMEQNYSTREFADKNRSLARIACIEVEFEEGEGL